MCIEQYIKKEIPTDTNTAERKGGGKNRTSLRHWEQQDGSEPTTKKLTKNDEREDLGTYFCDVNFQLHVKSSQHHEQHFGPRKISSGDCTQALVKLL